MINRKLAIRSLWWKDIRLLLPLVLLLLGVGAFLHLMFLLVNQPMESAHAMVLIGLPGLFAVGAGALLVGQEKELRTLGWLETLPIGARDLMRSKLAVSLLGLTAVWIVSLAMALLAMELSWRGGSRFYSWQWTLDDFGPIFFVPLNSLFLLFVGLATAWRFKSAFIGLLVLVPIAVLPSSSAGLIEQIFFTREVYNNFWWDWAPNFTWFGSASLVIFSAVALWYGWRAGLHCLGPAPAVMSQGTASTASQWFGYSSSVRNQPQARLSALLWQFTMQNRAILLGLGGMLLFAILGVWQLETQRMNRSTMSGADKISLPLTLAIFSALPAISWLGVSTFQADRLRQRIRFLADRGVSANLTWLTRQAVPLSILAAAIFGIALVGVRVLDDAEHGWTRVIPTVAIICGLCIVVYSISQWTSQLLSSPILAAIVAPLVSVAAGVYANVAYVFLGSPIWWLGICAIIPIVATFCLMKHWMDGTLGLVFWGGHASVLVGCLTIPAVPLLITLVTSPSAPKATIRELDASATNWSQFQQTPRELVLSMPLAMSSAASNSTANADQLSIEWQLEAAKLTFAEQFQLLTKSFRDQLAPPSVPIKDSYRVIGYLRSSAVLARLRLQDEAANKNSVDEASTRLAMTERYRVSFELLTAIAGRMRLSPRLIDQDAADLIEIWMLLEMKQPQAKQWLGDDAYFSALKILADASGRDIARRRAIALSWAELKKEMRFSSTQYQYGGYPLGDRNRVMGSLRQQIVTERRVGLGISSLWEYAKAGKIGATDAKRSELASFWGQNPSYYGIGPYGSYYRTDDLKNGLTSTLDVQGLGPVIASQWFGNWENQAQELSRENAN